MLALSDWGAGRLVPGKNAMKLLVVSRHKSMDAMRGYVRNRDLFRDYGDTCVRVVTARPQRRDRGGHATSAGAGRGTSTNAAAATRHSRPARRNAGT